MEHSSNLQNSQIPASLPPLPWTFEDDKIFQYVMAEVDHASPTIYQDIARRMPWKSMEEIQHQYGLLIQKLSCIHSGYYPQQIYNGGEEDKNLEESSNKRKKYTRANPGKSYQWTNEEHQLFLMGLEQYGKGDWKSISMNCVRSKTPMQVASHAQKYFKRLNNPTPSNKRRYSIHDSLIDPTIFPPTDAESQIHQHNPPPPPPQIIETQNPFLNPLELHPIPIPNPCELPPNPNPNPNPNISNTGEGLLVGLPPENNSASTTNELSFLSDPLSNDWFLFDPPALELDLFDDLPQVQQSPTK